jgi:triosephosphate isomerase (TIM)
MYRGLEITPPFFEIGPKAYLYGADVLQLARHADKVGKKYAVQMIITPQYVDIPILARELENVLVFAQHMDSLEAGRGVGSVLPEALKAAGAVGVMLNHAEKRISKDELQLTIKRADDIGLATMVCADSLEDAEMIAHMEPNIIIAESPDLIGAGKRSADDQVEIIRINETVWEINPEIRILHGAGIRCAQDVYDVMAHGAQGTGSTSGILLSNDPFRMVEDMVRSVREAWNNTYYLRRVSNVSVS